MMLSFVVALFYLCYGKFRFTFDKTTTIFGGLYAVCYCVCTVALFGIFAYSTSPSVAFYFGLALFAVSLFFLGKKKTSEEKKSFSVKWLIYVLANFLRTAAVRYCKRISKGSVTGIIRVNSC